MLINGIDISSLGVKLYDRVLNSNDIDTVDDWLDGDIQPTNIRQQEKFRNIQLSFLVLGTNEQDAFYRISRLTKELKKATVVFDDINLSFDVAILGSANTRRLKNGNFIVSYNLHSDYAKGDREIYTTNANLTNAFKLNLLYYQNSTQLLSSESITIRASSFTGVNDTLASIGIDVDKYMPDYYNHGIATNINGLEINYANLQYLGTLIINYTPIQYNLVINYMMDDGTGFFNEILQETITFTHPQLQTIQTIGQLIKPQRYKPDGYKSNITFDGDLTVENILALSPIQVLYEKIENAQSKNILVGYYQEDDNGNWQQITTQIVNMVETQFYDGLTLGEIFDVNAYRPNQIHYNEGYFLDHNKDELITYDKLELSYSVRYPRLENIIFVEYYAGVFPDWYRIATSTITTKYKDSYETNFTLAQLGIDLNRYHSAVYEEGRVYNTGALNTYDNVINAGVLQVYYVPIDYEIVVNFYTEGIAEPNTQTFTINALDFFGEPVLSDLIPIGDYKPEGHQMDPDRSYNGEISLSALTQASPITIMFEEIEADRTKNVLIHYKQELASVYSAINTSLITINESDCVGGVRLRDIINLDLYRPTYYDTGLIDGYSSNVLLSYEDINSEYNVLYNATTYSTPVRYYTDDVDDANWIGSTSINYRIIDFEITTTLYDLGLNVNAFKPSYCDDGVIQYRGAVSFQALRDIQSIDVVYDTVDEPSDDDGIDYPHRFLFLQHNDLGDYEGLHPEWTMNHAYINTGITAQDMSKLTVVMECKRVDENVPLHDVNGAYGYLFGSSSGTGSFFMRFNNQTQYHSGELTGVNTYEAKAGYYTNQLTLTEESAIGWSLNSGIYASARDGYSNATFTYTNPLQTENTRMAYPLYLFANNQAGHYEYGLAGIGIYGCRIYYDNVLVRDMIPVQFYDKIGDQVAPSNCLYDKVTKTFFEDGTGMNSFNIIDDDRYEDTNPDHKIGFCYVNYYQGSVRFKTSLFYFRASDFIDQVYDPYTKWGVDENQPSYYKPGVISDYSNIDRSFNGLNNHTFSVVYEEDENQIVVNYYQDSGVGEPTLLHTDIIQLKERDFYQVPTFGDIVRLNKYKPEGYKTNYEFPEPKVSLTRVLNHSPYTITYVPEEDELQDYTTTVRYIKKVFGIRTYETIGELTLHFDQTDFRDGEYIDFYIDKNAMKPEKYYLDGDYYQWYEMDERLTAPENLKEVYTIVYGCETQYLDVNYYTDEWDEANLIASTTWSFKLDDFDPAYPFYLVDQLPNTYINKFRPANCDGGILQDSNVQHTFFTLAELDEIAIVYMSITEPSDPTEAYYERKVLYWGDLCNRLYPSIKEIPAGINNGTVIEPWRVPYFDLGYKPKEISRLRVEFTGATKPIGVRAPTSPYSAFDTAYTTIFGYWGGQDFTVSDTVNYEQVKLANILVADRYADKYPTWSKGSKGCFCIQTRLPDTEGANWIYSYNGPSSIDGYKYTDNVLAGNNTVGFVYWTKPGMIAHLRNGFNYDTNDNYETIDVFKDYRYSKWFRVENVPDKETDGFMSVNGSRFQAVGLNSYDDTKPIEGQDGTWYGDYGFANPFTVVLDAYNNYCSIWNYHDSNYPMVWNIDNTDNPIWEDIERPRGSLSLFTSTNPYTGKPNRLDNIYWSYPNLGLITGPYGNAFGQSAVGINPYMASENDKYGSIEYQVETVVSQPSDGSAPVVQVKTQTRNVLFANWMIPTFPWLAGGIVWNIKIYDQDKLVRDLIPVAKGDQIYDYVMPENGLFDLVTEIFFGDSNPGTITDHHGVTKTYEPAKIYVLPDILSLGKITTNYYDYDNTFIDHKFVDVPTWFCGSNTTIEEILEWNDYKPDDYHLDGWLDVDADWSWQANKMNLAQIYEMGTANVYYRLRTFTKTVVYYQDNVRVGSRDITYSLEDIRNANTLSGLGIDVDLYYDPHFKHGRIVYNEQIIADDDIEAFINAPSPVVIYDKLTQEEAPNLLYVEYYRGGAYDEDLITLDENDVNYLNCNLTARVLNPNGAIKYFNHYHQALYEDENFGEFIPYQVRVLNKYTGLHYGPARKYKTLAMVVNRDTYTIIQERNGWGRLKEYPNAWILLSATEPITGPGQNPDYDTGFGKAIADVKVNLRSSTNEMKDSNIITAIPAGAEMTIIGETTTAGDRQWVPVVYGKYQGFVEADYINIVKDYLGEQTTVPFGEYVDITKMTIDRLWCYVPEFESWIKAEDISFNQAGKFLNGLKIEVIDLDKIDFRNVASLSDIGVEIQKYRMRFHNNSSYTYDGDYTYDAFSRLHNIDIVYPETIYNYSCIYYKDNKAEINRLGASAFSCSISDWNPDWDKFIETSWQTVEIPGSAELTSNVNLREEPNLNTGAVLTTVSKDTVVEIMGPMIETGTKNWYPVRYGEYNGYMVADYLTNIVAYGGTADINPTLYRETAITLTWDYFGFDNNRYRPDGYGEGIYLWNPRSWDKDNVKFSFEELIRCGTQYVVYPIFDPDTYKIWIQGNYVGASRQYTISDPSYGNTYYTMYMNNPGVKVDLSDATHGYELYANEHYSVYGAGEWRIDLGQGGHQYSGSLYYVNSGKDALYNTRLGSFVMNYPSSQKFNGLSMPYNMSMINSNHNVPDAFANVKNGDVIIGDYSNYRYSPTGMFGIGNDYEGREREYYIYNTLTPVQDNTNLTKYHIERSSSNNATIDLREQWCRGVVYEIMSYYDFMMIHYYVPVPKGLWYKYNGETLRIPDNGLFDLLTGEFKRGFRANLDSSMKPTGFSGTLTDGKELIFLRNQNISDNAYDLFSNWNYNATDVELYKQTTETTIGYAQPDEYSIQIRELTPGLVLPISKQADENSQTRVVGNWDKSCDQWIKRDKLKAVSGYSGGTVIPEEATYSLVPGTISNFYVYNDPLKVSSVGQSSNYSYGSSPAVIKVYYACATTAGGMLFDGAHWIPRYYTNSATKPLNKNYVITQNTSYYKFPIDDVEYRIDSYLYGDRITVLYVCQNNENWGYTGEGWIQIDGNTSEVL